jgi:hypothetical protein
MSERAKPTRRPERNLIPYVIGPVRQPWSTTESHERTGRTPLVVSIAEFGDARPKEEKIPVIAHSEGILRFIGAEVPSLAVAPSLLDDLGKAILAARPLGDQVLTREPEDDEKQYTEGRGIYYPDFLIGEGVKRKRATIYVKGTGNAENFIGESAPFPGFPSQEGKLFYDDPSRLRPRIVGAEYMPGALLELINSSIHFAWLASKNNWTSLDQAIDAGVAIPLFATHFTEISKYLKGRVDQERQQTDDERIKEALDWKKRFFGVGTVTQIVPSSTRVGRGRGPTVAERLTDPSTYEKVGRALHTNIGSGLVLHPSSAHLQNVHAEGSVTADFSDQISLADIHDLEGVRTNSGETVKIPASYGRTALVFNEFDNSQMLLPPHYPDPDLNWSAEHVATVQQRFWSKMLEGYSNPDAITERTMSLFMPLLRTEFLLAASSVLVLKHTKDKWDEMSLQRYKLLMQFSDYSVMERYIDLFSTGISQNDVVAVYDMRKNDRLPVVAIVKFLQTGDIQDLQEGKRRMRGQKDRLTEALNLASSLQMIPDQRIKDELIILAGNYFGRRDIEKLARRPDAIAAFETVQYGILDYFINEGRYDEAKLALEILLWSQEDGFKDAYRPDQTAEPSEFYYVRQLVELGFNPTALVDIHEQCAIDRNVHEFTSETKPLELPQQPEQGLLDPEVLIRSLLQNASKSRDKMFIYKWLRKYNTALRKEKDEGKDSSTSSLDAMAEEVKDTYPELAFGHACIMAARYRSVDPQLANEYQRQALLYYKTEMQERAEELGVSLEFLTPSPEERTRQYNNLSELYKDNNQPIIAEMYNRLASGEIEEFSW